MLHVAFVRSVHAHAADPRRRHGRRAAAAGVVAVRDGRRPGLRRHRVARALGAAGLRRDRAAGAGLAEGALRRRGGGRRGRPRPLRGRGRAPSSSRSTTSRCPRWSDVAGRARRRAPSSTTRRPTTCCCRAGSRAATSTRPWPVRPSWSSARSAPTGRPRRRSRAAAAWRTGTRPRASSPSGPAPRSRTWPATRLAEILGLAENRVRVVAPDVGGGFGREGRPLSRGRRALPARHARCSRPVKWVEHAARGPPGRRPRARPPLRGAGRLRRRRRACSPWTSRADCNAGAYSVYPWTAGIEALMAGGLLTGPYKLRALPLRRGRRWRPTPRRRARTAAWRGRPPRS